MFDKVNLGDLERWKKKSTRGLVKNEK